jgi:hypothetical protein
MSSSLCSARFQVPLWSVDDVLKWVKKIGFSDYLPAFAESRVDGDLLLQLDEANLKDDLRMTNGILRRRFTRELSRLKRTADYSSCDRHAVASFLQEHAQLGEEFAEYAYGLIQHGLSVDMMRRLAGSSLDDALKEAGVATSVHRQRIAEAVFSDPGQNECSSLTASDLEVDRLSEPSYDVYVCNANPASHGSRELASLIEVHLKMRGFTVFLGDSNSPNPANRMCDSEMCAVSSNVSTIQRCRHFVLVLTPGTLDDFCNLDPDLHDQFQSVVKPEKIRLWADIVAALQSKDCNIVPVIDPNFQFPDPDELPENMRALCYFNSVRWIHDYQDACIDKLEKFIRGEPYLKNCDSFGRLYSSTPSFLTVNHGYGGSRSRNDSGRSTPTRMFQQQPHHYRQHSPPMLLNSLSAKAAAVAASRAPRTRNDSLDSLLASSS